MIVIIIIIIITYYYYYYYYYYFIAFLLLFSFCLQHYLGLENVYLYTRLIFTISQYNAVLLQINYHRHDSNVEFNMRQT